MNFDEVYDALMAAEEAENQVWQRGRYASDAERQAAEDTADAAYAAVVDVVHCS